MSAIRLRLCISRVSTRIHHPRTSISASPMYVSGLDSHLPSANVHFGFAARCEARLRLAVASLKIIGAMPLVRACPSRVGPEAEPGIAQRSLKSIRRGIASPHIRRRSRNEAAQPKQHGGAVTKRLNQNSYGRRATHRYPSTVAPSALRTSASASAPRLRSWRSPDSSTKMYQS